MISQVVIAFAIGIGLLILSRLLASWGVAPENANFFRDVGIFAFLIGGLLIWDTKLGRNLNFVGSRRALRLNEKNLKEQGYTQFWEDKREVGSPAK